MLRNWHSERDLVPRDTTVMEQVAVVSIRDTIHAALTEAFALTAGVDSVISSGDLVILKPNFVAARRAETGVTTDLRLVQAVASEVKNRGATPLLIEFPGMEFEPDSVYSFLGVHDFARKNGIEVYREKREVRVGIPHGKAMKSVSIPEVLTRGKIVNMPKPKAHAITGITAAMKNLMGVLSPTERRRMHIHGVDQAIVDLNKVIKPVLNIMDCTVLMEGDAVFGNKLSVDMLIASRDALAIDWVVCQMLGLEPERIRHLELGQAQLGRREIRTVGDARMPPNFRFRLPDRPAWYKALYRSMYFVDVPFFAISGQHFNRFLYSRGIVGNRPYLIRAKCDQCGQCVNVCPAKGVIDMQKYGIRHSKCIKCMLCLESCPTNAITLKGSSRRPNNQL